MDELFGDSKSQNPYSKAWKAQQTWYYNSKYIILKLIQTILLPVIQTLFLYFCSSLQIHREQIKHTRSQIPVYRPYKQTLIKHIFLYKPICTHISVITFLTSIISISTDVFCPSPSFSFPLSHSLERCAGTDVTMHYFNLLPPNFLLFHILSIFLCLSFSACNFILLSFFFQLILIFAVVHILHTQILKGKQKALTEGDHFVPSWSFSLSLHTQWIMVGPKICPALKYSRCWHVCVCMCSSGCSVKQKGQSELKTSKRVFFLCVRV